MQLFTVEQANRTLPLVRRIVEDIVATYGRWQDRVREFEVLAAGSRAGASDPRADALQREAQTLASEIAGFVGELEALGVECKGYDIGLVDFPSEMNGQLVYLCWRLGEPAVEHWHERDSGFGARRPLSPAALR